MVDILGDYRLHLSGHEGFVALAKEMERLERLLRTHGLDVDGAWQPYRCQPFTDDPDTLEIESFPYKLTHEGVCLSWAAVSQHNPGGPRILAIKFEFRLLGPDDRGHHNHFASLVLYWTGGIWGVLDRGVFPLGPVTSEQIKDQLAQAVGEAFDTDPQGGELEPEKVWRGIENLIRFTADPSARQA